MNDGEIYSCIKGVDNPFVMLLLLYLAFFGYFFTSSDAYCAILWVLDEQCWPGGLKTSLSTYPIPAINSKYRVAIRMLTAGVAYFIRLVVSIILLYP